MLTNDHLILESDVPFTPAACVRERVREREREAFSFRRIHSATNDAGMRHVETGQSRGPKWPARARADPNISLDLQSRVLVSLADKATIIMRTFDFFSAALLVAAQIREISRGSA